jgi:hypothetical protein
MQFLPFGFLVSRIITPRSHASCILLEGDGAPIQTNRRLPPLAGISEDETRQDFRL